MTTTQAQEPHGPLWDQLYEIASAQDGHFTTSQAATAGYSPQLLAKYLKNGRISRVRRGIYRLVHLAALQAIRDAESSGELAEGSDSGVHGISVAQQSVTSCRARAGPLAAFSGRTNYRT